MGKLCKINKQKTENKKEQKKKRASETENHNLPPPPTLRVPEKNHIEATNE
jgi:hypothetical protein